LNASPHSKNFKTLRNQQKYKERKNGIAYWLKVCTLDVKSHQAVWFGVSYFIILRLSFLPHRTDVSLSKIMQHPVFKQGMMHACNPSSQRLRQEDSEFEANLDNNNETLTQKKNPAFDRL
jgi:hypothetical protein